MDLRTATLFFFLIVGMSEIQGFKLWLPDWSPKLLKTESDSCSGQPGVYLPVDDNCNDFYLCISEKLKRFRCPNGMYLDARAGFCKIDTENKCNLSLTTEAVNLATESVATTTETQICSSDSNGRFVAGEKCNLFYLCSDGQAVPLKCPNGQMFSDKLGYCIVDTTGVCGNSTSTTSTTEGLTESTETSTETTSEQVTETSTTEDLSSTEEPITVTEISTTTESEEPSTSEETYSSVKPSSSEAPSTSEGPSTSEELSTTEEPSTSEEPSASEEPSTTEQPSTSVKPSSSEVPTTSEEPSTSEKPSSPTTSTSDKPTTPSASEAPITSEEPSTSEKPSSPTTSTSDKPTTPSTSEAPITSEKPSTSEEQSTSEKTSTSEAQSTSEAPSTTQEPSTSGAPSTSEKPSTEVPSTTDADAPQTTLGDLETTTESASTNEPFTSPSTANPETTSTSISTNAPSIPTEKPETTSTNPTTKEPETTIEPDNVCQGVTIGAVPHADCDKYHFCNQEVATVQVCPEGDYFDKEANECKKDVDGVCLSRCTNSETGTRFANEDNCASYYECRTGDEYLESCSVGEYFNSKTMKCDEDVERTCIATLKNPCQNEENGTMMVGDNCASYYLCNNKSTEVKECLNGYRFDEKDLKCVEDVDGKCPKTQSTTVA